VCGRFVQEKSLTEVAEIFEAELLVEDPGPRYNVAPTDPAAVVVQRPDGPRGLTIYQWGLVPGWADSAAAAARHINARSETAATSPVFREALKRRRCIVPADGFYEWTKTGSTRQPYFIHNRDATPLALAGVWSSWRPPGAEVSRRSFSILTTRANEAIAPLHDRMPVALPRDAWSRWLDPTIAEDELLAMLQPADPEPFETYPVVRLVNNVRNQGPELLEPLPAG
jgi:putative SOS response-associated peptidase YedK